MKAAVELFATIVDDDEAVRDSLRWDAGRRCQGGGRHCDTFQAV